MSRLKQALWAAVQHSGFAYGDHLEFEQGLESYRVNTTGEYNRVIRAGGQLFTDYTEAEDYCDKEQYPEPIKDFDLTPHAPGTFSRDRLNGLRIYIPVS